MEGVGRGATAYAPVAGMKLPDIVGDTMTEDARNSIYLWVASLAVFGFLWADIKFDLLPSLSTEWTPWIFGGVLLLNLLQMAFGFWRRRLSRSSDKSAS
ncbi:hypothetical protein MTsPCn3_18110 [Erythrobacter sp. MTPC3]